MKNKPRWSSVKNKMKMNIRMQFLLAMVISAVAAFIVFMAESPVIPVLIQLNLLPNVFLWNVYVSFTLLSAILTFFIVFYLMTRKQIRNIQLIARALREVSKGNLAIHLDVDSQNEIGMLAAYTNRMAEDLKRLREEDKKREEYKDELVANVSHDLRTPLTSIMGYLQLIEDRKFENKHAMYEYVASAMRKAEQLNRLVDDLFEYTKLHTEGITLEKEQVTLNAMIHQFVEEWVPVAIERGMEIQSQIPSDNVLVIMDTNQMLRVFENLLINALKYGRKDSVINVSVGLETADRAIITVSNLVEVMPADLSRIFERSYMGDTSRQSDMGGSGLGLAIAKNIVELHGGEIWADKDGSMIRFHVALKKE